MYRGTGKRRGSWLGTTRARPNGPAPARRSSLHAAALCGRGLFIGLTWLVGLGASLASIEASPLPSTAIAAVTVDAGADPASAVVVNDDLPASIDAILAELALDPSQISLFAQRVDQSQPSLQFNASIPRTPASVEKLVTTMAALDILGRGYRWPTEVYTTGTISAGVLDGDMILKGYGDPTLSNGAYTDLLRALREKGIERIQGDLIIDPSAIEPPAAERGDFDGAAQSAYNALPAALSVNRQVTDIHVYHDRVSGQVGVYTDPPLSGVEIVNSARIIEAPCRGRDHRLQVKLVESEQALAKIEVSGTFASECPDERIPRLLLSPEQHAASAFHALWGQLGGRVEGRIRVGAVPDDAILLHRAESPPLAELIRDLNKWSDNLMARLLFLSLGLQQQGPPASLEKSRERLVSWLESLGIEHSGMLIDNGSGLSRDSQLSAQTLGELLVLGYHAPWMPELLASMAIAGVDGTMRRRLRHEPITGRAHLKTGTLRDASCIAGYVLDKNQQRWALVVMVNAIPGQRLAAWHGHAVHHALLRWLYEDPPQP